MLLALAAAALAASYALFVPKPPPPRSRSARPLSTGRGPDGYLALWRALAEQDIPETSLRYRYDRLPTLAPHPSGNLLIVTQPGEVPVRPDELADLERWVARGNTLLVMAALDDTPRWSVPAPADFVFRLERLTGLDFTASTARGGDRSPGTSRITFEPVGDHPLLSGVGDFTALSPLPASRWRASAREGRPALALAERADDGDPALWLERRGEGQIIVCAAGSVFSNAAMTHGGNARLFSNIVAWSLGPGGAVIFDDAHQGETAFYDARAFFADPRLHGTLAWIVLLWLVFVLGPLPMNPARDRWRPLDEAAYVEASARYFATVVRPPDAARRLIEEFFRGLRARLGAADASAVWRWLDSHAAVSAGMLARLKQCEADARAGARIDLVRVQNLLADLRRSVE